MGKKSEENYSKPLKTAFYNLKKMRRVKWRNRMCKIERWGNWHDEEMGGLETSIWHGLKRN